MPMPSRPSEGLDTRIQARQLPRHRVGMDNTLATRALHFRLRIPQSRRSRFLVATRDGEFDLLDEGAHTRLARLITSGTGNGLTDALTRGCGIGHASSFTKISLLKPNPR